MIVWSGRYDCIVDICIGLKFVVRSMKNEIEQELKVNGEAAEECRETTCTCNIDPDAIHRPYLKQQNAAKNSVAAD